MLDYNIAILKSYQNRQALQDAAVTEWKANHGTTLPVGMDMEQAEEYLATADEYGVDLKRPWFYQSNMYSHLDGAFNTDKAYDYLHNWLLVHGYEGLVKEVGKDCQPKTDYIEFFFTDNHITPLEFLEDAGFTEWQ